MIEVDSNVVDASLIDEDNSSAQIGNDSILDSTEANKTNEQKEEEKKLKNTPLKLDWGLVFTFF
jgi:hypothetical protein